MKKINTNSIFFLLIIVYSIISSIKINSNQLVSAVLLIFVNIIGLISVRKNKKIFVLLLMLLYFNYSIVICKYLFGGSSLLNNLYSQLRSYDETMNLSINLLLLFNTLLIFIIGKIKTPNNIETSVNEHVPINKKKLFPLYIIFSLMIMLLLFYMWYNKVTSNTTLFEYFIIIFVCIFYITKNDKKAKIWFEILMIIIVSYSFFIGERIGGLQILLCDFLINYLEKINIRQIIISGIIGVISFTLLGIYGDILDTDKNFDGFTFKRIYSEISERRFASDTAVSAYFPTVGTIEASKIFYSKEDRYSNGVKYFKNYTFSGQSLSGYKLPIEIIRKNYFHTGGGIIIGYFYFWFGLVGVILIGIYVGGILKSTLNSNKKNDFLKIYGIFILSTFPRWYIYYPTFLFRGSLLFIIFYLIIINSIYKKIK